jgi:hypothetical protein
MTMVPDPDEATQKLLRLLALKRHELPPSGFFGRLPHRVLLQIRADAGDGPWWRRFWDAIAREPMVAGSYAALGAGALVFGVSVFQMALDQDGPAFVGLEGMSAPAPEMSVMTAPTLPSGVIYRVRQDDLENPGAMGISMEPFDSGFRGPVHGETWHSTRVSLTD